ncbi:MAG: hypothetical protein WC100_05865 [Sterolibacterium sp.]
MPSPTTALQIITDALYLTRAVGVDQTLTNQEVSDGLRAFNDLVDGWSTQKLAVYSRSNQTFNTINGQKVYTIGPGGDWNTDRPVGADHIGPIAYSSLPVGASQPSTYPCLAITQEKYNLISVKDQQQQYPNFYLFVNQFPLGEITLWPVPNQVTPITFSIDQLLTQPATSATVVNFPPGYVKAFKYNLAIELAPLFGQAVPPDVKEIAVKSLADIKRANKVTPLMNYDPMTQYNAVTNWQGWY